MNRRFDRLFEAGIEHFIVGLRLEIRRLEKRLVSLTKKGRFPPRKLVHRLETMGELLTRIRALKGHSS
jgi:hypothetical protein